MLLDLLLGIFLWILFELALQVRRRLQRKRV
jgi:hypothetical protein